MKSEQMAKLGLRGGGVDSKVSGFFRARPCCCEGDLFFHFFPFGFFLNHLFHFEAIRSFPCYFEIGRELGDLIDFGRFDLLRAEIKRQV